MNVYETVAMPTRRLSREKVDLLLSLKPGQRIEITQSVRVGGKKWKTTVAGVFRGLNYLATGVTTERVPEDDIVVPVLHFTKDNSELSSISIDENSEVKLA